MDSSETALKNLSTLLGTSPKCLGKVSFDFLHDIFCPIKPIGRGSTRWILEALMASNREITRAVKISCNKEALQVERILSWEQFRREWTAMLPRVDTEMQSKLNPACPDYITSLLQWQGNKLERNLVSIA